MFAGAHEPPLRPASNERFRLVSIELEFRVHGTVFVQICRNQWHRHRMIVRCVPNEKLNSSLMNISDDDHNAMDARTNYIIVVGAFCLLVARSSPSLLSQFNRLCAYQAPHMLVLYKPRHCCQHETCRLTPHHTHTVGTHTHSQRLISFIFKLTLNLNR